VVPVRRKGNVRIPVLASLLLLLLGSSIASAAGSSGDIRSTLVVISLLSLPLFGLVVLLIIALPEMLGRPYRFEPAGYHVANVLAVVFLLTFVDALLTPYVLVEGVNSTLSFVIVGVLDLMLVTGVFIRHLLFPLRWATAIGGAWAIIMVVRAFIAIEMPAATLFRLEDVLRLSLPVTAIIFIGLLLMETARYHLAAEDDHREPEGPRVPGGRRMLRLGEVLITTFALSVGVAIAWL
jgi:hypothetical protein